MESQFNYTLIGAFVLLFGAALIGGVLWLSADISSRDYKTYRVYMTESVSGLEDDASVNYRGVEVGRVREISLDSTHPQRVAVLLDIESDVIVRQNDAARLETTGVTGINYINILGGTPDASPLRARKGEPYPVIESNPSLLGRLDATLSILGKNLMVTSDKINDLFSDDNRESFAQILSNIETATGSMAGRAPKIGSALDDLADAMGNTRRASVRLPDIMTRAEHSMRSIERTTRRFAIVMGNLDQSVITSGRDVERFTAQALPEATALVVELRQMVANLRRLSEELARDPSTIIFGSPEVEPGPGE
ncbi:MAG: MCE family protein [Gammaproteobacteria bacterium]|nr:MCE family protein [Gammaproteobacteria bacterium]